MLEDILGDASLTLFTCAAQHHKMRLSDAAAVMANWNGNLWSTVGGSISNMSDGYCVAISTGRSM